MARVKKNADGNRYLLTQDGVWVRDLTNAGAPYVDLNGSVRPEDHFTILQNEVKNRIIRCPWVDSEKFYFRDVVIVSDGHQFESKQAMLQGLPKTTTIIAVNGALRKWSLPRSPTCYVVNNPYDDCLRFLPRPGTPLPRCIASVRTNHRFLKSYDSNKYRYYPVNDPSFASTGANEVHWQVDDYRNPVCAAISLAYRFGAETITLFCCDDSFESERPASVKVADGLWTYPQHVKVRNTIDGMFFWLRNHPSQKYGLYDHSSSGKYRFAEYIHEKDFPSFFNKAGEKNE